MVSPGNLRCANCIGTLSFQHWTAYSANSSRPSAAHVSNTLPTPPTAIRPCDKEQDTNAGSIAASPSAEVSSAKGNFGHFGSSESERASVRIDPRSMELSRRKE